MDPADDFCDTAGMEAHLLVVDDPSEADRLAILNLLADFNSRNAPPTLILPLAILLTSADDETIGGLWGASGYDWLFIELVFVPDNLRGQDLGSEMMRRAEEVAIQRGCTGIWLTTFSFQARGFYEKLGYRMFGEIIGHPVGRALYFLEKRLGAGARAVSMPTSTLHP